MTERLQIVTVDEDSPHTAVRFDVIDIRRAHAREFRHPLPSGAGGASAAERLTEELVDADAVAPKRELIPPMPLGGGSTAPIKVVGTMRVTVGRAC